MSIDLIKVIIDANEKFMELSKQFVDHIINTTDLPTCLGKINDLDSKFCSVGTIQSLIIFILLYQETDINQKVDITWPQLQLIETDVLLLMQRNMEN